MNYKEYLMERFLTESKIQTYEELASEIKKSILKAFPDTFVDASVWKMLGTNFTVRFAVGKDKTEYSNGIINNDPYFATWMIHNINPNEPLPETLVIEPLPTAKYYYDKNNQTHKLPARKVTKKIDVIPDYFYKFFKDVKSTMSANKENMSERIRYKL